jgi:hypothetical protein
MKKLILSAAIVLGSLSTFAQTSTAPKVPQTTQAVEEKFTEIKLEEVPALVQTALKSAHPEAILEKAYVNEKKEFKLEIKIGDQKTTVFADADGNWIKK